MNRRRFLEHAVMAGLLARAGAVGGQTRQAAQEWRPEGADASAMAAAIKRKQVTAAELVDAALARLQAVNPRLNAVSKIYAERARQQAAAPGAGSAGGLAGIPIVIKDNVEEKDAPDTHGCRMLAGEVGKVDSPTVAAMRSAGLISIGRSNLPEYSLSPTSEALLFGPTRTPWNLDHSAGGSSGGAAACVAAGVVPVAHATDGAGSIRNPASCNGLVGLKSSRARMKGEEAHKGVTAMQVNGCVSRTVRDTAAWLAAMESQAGPMKPVGLVTGPADRPFRVGIRPEGLAGLPDADVLAVFQSTTKTLTRLGHRIVDAPMPFDASRVLEAVELTVAATAVRRIEALTTRFGRPPGPADMESLTFGMAALARKAGKARQEAAVATLERMTTAHIGEFERFDILLMPILASAPPAIGFMGPTVPYDELRSRINRYTSFTPIQNVSGACAIALPIGTSAKGLPIGMQFIAPPGGERRLIELAYALEAELDWARRKPAVWAA